MVNQLLLRGMLVGVLAGLLAFGFARVFGEPAVNQAIAFEEASGGHSHGDATPVPAPHIHGADAKDGHAHPAGGADAHSHAAAEPEPELFSRSTQSGLGLFTGMVVYGAAMGGLFALAFAFTNGRVGPLSPRATSALLALGAFVAITLVPALKYPANPPAVGDGATIGLRTQWFFMMLAMSIAALVGAVILARSLVARHGRWNAALLGGAAYVLVIGAVLVAMPTVDEVPAAFSATLLWQFRLAALGIQLVLWTTLGLVFGALVDGAFARRSLSGAIASGLR